MSAKRQKLIAIVGPTASGKSELAVLLAKKLNGEIISADSRQVYRGLNIGTGKITKKEMRGVKHYMLDITDPRRQYSAAQYQKAVHKILNNIFRRQSISFPIPHPIPLLVGGTGFWIDAVVYNLSLPEVPPNMVLRKKLERKTATELLTMLKKLDPERARTIEQKNPRRLIRAIEIARVLGRVPPLQKRPQFNVLWLGIKKPKEKLRHLIDVRLKKRLKQGMVREVRKLLQRGVSHRRLQELGLEYRFLSLYLQGKLQKQQMVQKLQKAIEQYARRQMVWFKRNKKIRWVTTTKEAEKKVREFLPPHH